MFCIEQLEQNLKNYEFKNYIPFLYKPKIHPNLSHIFPNFEIQPKFSQIAKPLISQLNDFKFSQISGIWIRFSQIGHPVCLRFRDAAQQN